MVIEYLLVTFHESRTVLANDTVVGVTNHTLLLPPAFNYPHFGSLGPLMV